jgi:hypothetical protein
VTVACRGVRPTLDGLGNMLNAHGEMKPIQHMVGRIEARRLTQGSRPFGAVAQDGDHRARRRTKAMQHAVQLLPLSVSLGRHAAEHDLLAVVVGDLRNDRRSLRECPHCHAGIMVVID